jgi:hypothetical protein
MPKLIMTEEIKKEKVELSKEQQEELESLFQYNEKADYTEEEKVILKEMFDSPEKLLILRKALSLYTSEERGLKYVSPQNIVEANIKDLQSYAIETAVSNLATEKVRTALYSLYRMLHASKVVEKRAEFEKKNLESFEEGKKVEKFNEEKEQADKVLGENL